MDKDLVLQEDIIIPKGTKFIKANRIFASYVYQANIGDGMINSTLSIHFSDDTLKEIGEKFKEI